MWNEELSGKNCAFLRRLREHVPAASRLLAKHDSPDPAARCLPSIVAPPPNEYCRLHADIRSTMQLSKVPAPRGERGAAARLGPEGGVKDRLNVIRHKIRTYFVVGF
jgi:hypothetical protein